ARGGVVRDPPRRRHLGPVLARVRGPEVEVGEQRVLEVEVVRMVDELSRPGAERLAKRLRQDQVGRREDRAVVAAERTAQALQPPYLGVHTANARLHAM